MRLQGFYIRINDGPKQFFPIKTTVYRDAAAAVPAVYGRHLPVDVEIWATHEGQELGRFRYHIRENEFGQFLVEHMVKAPQPAAAGQG